MDDRQLVVLESFGPPHRMTNPYLTQLFASLQPHVVPLHFSWRRALLGSYDVFHLHWPEVLVAGRTRVRTALRCALVVAILLRLRVQRRALVRTLHNLAPHEPPSGLAARVIDLTARRTTLWVTLSDRTDPPTSAPAVLAPIGHYRDWFAEASPREPIRGRLVHFGHLRPYKGVERLLEAFAQLDEPEASLHIIGRVADGGLAAVIRDAVEADPRIVARTDYVPDDELVEEVTAAELVVLPFTEITNSSSLLLALSLDRPVLVPEGPVTDEVAAEVGEGWVLTYSGPLRADRLASAIDEARRPRPTRRPDLEAREWVIIGQQHATAFRRAVALARQR